MRRFLFQIYFVLAFPAFALAQYSSAALNIKILEEGNDHSIDGASVRLSREHHVLGQGINWTDLDKRTHGVLINKLETGNDYVVEVRAWSDEWSPERVPHVTVVAGQTKQITIHMKRILSYPASRSAVMKRARGADRHISNPGNLAK